jgi:hypothetical protein
MRARLAAAVAGTILIAAAVFAFSLSSHPVIAGTNTVEPVTPSVSVEGGQPQCQRIARVPAGADRLKLLVTFVTGGAHSLHIEITDPRGIVSTGDLTPATPGAKLIKLKPPTRAAHRATLCLSHPGSGRVMIGGDLKRSPGEPKGKEAEKQGVASAIFLRPGSSSWVAETDTIADRYANTQAGLLGGWAVWLAALLAIGAAVMGIWSVVILPGRRT